jgi:hypothetical protein
MAKDKFSRPESPGAFPPRGAGVTKLDLDRVHRSAVPLRVAFLHRPQAGGGPGPLSAIVRARRETALDLLLFAHAIWPTTSPAAIGAPASDWEAAIAMRSRAGNRATISRAWTWLETQDLIRSTHRGRIRTIEIRREDASKRPWAHPSENSEPYLQLPHDYWYGGFARQLSLPGKAMLLIALSLGTPTETRANAHYFEFPLQRAAAWYGLTAESARIGLRDLRNCGLLRAWAHRRVSPVSPVGVTFDRRYSLNRLDAVAYAQHVGSGTPADADPLRPI